MKIELTSYDILQLLLEMPIKRENFQISSNASFLSIMSLFQHEMDKRAHDSRHDQQ